MSVWLNEFHAKRLSLLSLQDLQVEEAAHTTFKTLDEVFPEGSTIFMLGLPHYGAQGAVSTRSNL